MLLKFSTMSQNREKKKVALKTVYTHVIRAKLYGVLTVNALEGIMNEIDSMLPRDIQGTICLLQNTV